MRNDSRIHADSEDRIGQVKAMRFSMILAVKNGQPHVERCVRSLLSQEYPQQEFEVIVSDGCSTDGTWKVLKRLKQENPALKLLRNPKESAAAGLNLGIRQARGEYVCLTDADVIVPGHWLKAMESVLTSVDAEAVGGPNFIPPDSDPFSTAVGWIMSSPIATGGKHNPSVQHTMSTEAKYVGHLPTSNLCLRREIFDRIGFFDENFVRGKDLDFSIRMAMQGYRLYHSPDIGVWHYRRSSPGALARQVFDWGKVKAAVMKKHRFLQSIYLLPLYFLTAFLTLLIGTLLLGRFPIFIRSLLFVMSMYAIVVLFESIRKARIHRDWSTAVFGLLLFPLIHVSYTLGLLSGLIRNRCWPKA